MKLPEPIEQYIRACDGIPLDHLPVADQRAAARLLIDLNFLRFGQRGPAVHAVDDHLVPVDGGSVRIRLYRPSPAARLPLHVWLHGGGWWQGSIDELVSDAMCRQRAALSGVAIAAVDYRLAPEYRYPVALHDCRYAIMWLLENSASLGIDAASVSVGGNSAGANLAAALTLLLRDRDGVSLAAQLLEVPFLDLTLAPLRRAVRDGRVQDISADLELAVGRYLSRPQDALDQFASPLRAADLRGLPPALIYTAEFDPLHSEGARYAQRLREAGVAAAVVREPGAVHGSALLTRTWPPAAAWQERAAGALHAAHLTRNGSVTA
jgi:acetyl esterase